MQYFRDQGIVKPHQRSQFDKDLISFITKTLRKGDSLVLGIDMNEDARFDKLAQQLSSMGLRDLILSTHASSSPPATFNCNNIHIPVDTIWGSWAVDVICAGYGPFDA